MDEIANMGDIAVQAADWKKTADEMPPEGEDIWIYFELDGHKKIESGRYVQIAGTSETVGAYETDPGNIYAASIVTYWCYPGEGMPEPPVVV